MTVEGSLTNLLACCSTIYASPLVELIVGQSLHPGGLESTRQLLETSKLRPGERLLDAGCGPGASSRLAAEAFGLRVDAIDASPAVIARAGARDQEDRVRWLEADVLHLPYDGATFDGIVAECVLSTLPRAEALAEMRRVLRPGGWLVMSDVEVDDDPIPGLVDHGVLGAALCITDAWRAGELPGRLRDADFILERRWDCSKSIITLVDRVEARIRFAMAMARLAGLDFADLAAAATGGGTEPMELGYASRLADEVRAAVGDGSLRYFAAVARAGSQPEAEA